MVIVTYAAAGEIATCLETLLGAQGVNLRVVVVDNDSPDDTLAVIRSWADGTTEAHQSLPFDTRPVAKPIALDGSGSGHRVTLLPTGTNGGFAAGVNVGLAHLAADPTIDRFWILNPDCAVPPETPLRFLNEAEAFSIMGGRIVFLDDPDKIQIDGGRIQWWSGLTKNIAHLRDPKTTPAPPPQALDFISGASMVVSRAHYESIGPMSEDYFLYYEEVDWAQRRQLPLAYADGATVYHKGGASIGSRTSTRAASHLSTYFIHRARLRFLWRFCKSGIPGALLYSFAKAAQLWLHGNRKGAKVLLLATFQVRLDADSLLRR